MIDLRWLWSFFQQRRHNDSLRALSNQQQEFLVHIAVSPHPPLVGEIAIALKIDPANASHILKELVARGLVGVSRDTKDGRARRVFLLPTGQDICDCMAQEYRCEA